LDVSDVSNALCVLTALGQLPLGGEPILHVACLGTTTLNPDFVGALTYEVAFLQLSCRHLELTREFADRLQGAGVADLPLHLPISFGLLPKLACSLHWTPPGLNY
jgi:hypothetical protein